MIGFRLYWARGIAHGICQIDLGVKRLASTSFNFKISQNLSKPAVPAKFLVEILSNSYIHDHLFGLGKEAGIALVIDQICQLSESLP